ncbi:MAG: CoA ester lyase [Deltaproteobacteria bacterium]|nr:CoA ester lyase [Deltaproteobacteria bacterium]
MAHTPDAARPSRSALYVPASNARALAKAAQLDADALIFDLEDGVAPAAKEAARNSACKAAGLPEYRPREVFIRVNGAGTPWQADDLAAAAVSGADGVVMPKVESAAEVQAAAEALAAAGAPAGFTIVCMIETPIAVLRAAEIASAHPRVAGLMVGTADLAKALGAAHPPDRWTLIPALAQCVLAARAHGVRAWDGVHFVLNDDAGMEAACQQGRDLGFDGKGLIHPAQIPVANRVFAPSEAELAHARRVIAAIDAAAAEGRGVAVVDGQLVEGLHADAARRRLAMAAAIAARGA